MNRGDIYDIEFDWGSHPAVVVTRDTAIPVLRNITVVEVTSRIRELPTEVPLGTRNGLAGECVANCDNLQTIPQSALGRRRGALDAPDVRRLDGALRIALGLDP